MPRSSAPGPRQQQRQDHGLRERQHQQDPEIVGCEVLGQDRPSHMANGDAGIEQGDVTDDRALEGEAAPEGDDGDQTDGDVGDADLELERADLPSDRGRRDPRREETGENLLSALRCPRTGAAASPAAAAAATWPSQRQPGDERSRREEDDREVR